MSAALTVAEARHAVENRIDPMHTESAAAWLDALVTAAQREAFEKAAQDCDARASGPARHLLSTQAARIRSLASRVSK